MGLKKSGVQPSIEGFDVYRMEKFEIAHVGLERNKFEIAHVGLEKNERKSNVEIFIEKIGLKRRYRNSKGKTVQ